METLEQIVQRIAAGVPGAELTIVPNGNASQGPSLRVDPDHALATARFLRDTPGLQFDYASNVTGIDWPESVTLEKVRVRRWVEGEERELEETVERRRAGFLEAVYHLYSMALGHGPLVLRQRTGNRIDRVRVASLTPIYRGAELQEREIFDLFGVVFDGHPDLRRLLMWDGFQDHPMRRDYVEPDDYEYEPTPHDDLRDKARRHYPAPTRS